MKTQDRRKSRRPSGPEEQRLLALERAFKAMADRTRLQILNLLSKGEVCVCDIHETLGIPQPRASRHLAYLRRVGLVHDRKDGLWVYYRLACPDDPVLQTLMSSVLHCMCHVDGSVTLQAAPQKLRMTCCDGR